jgi:hypothetical protein
MSRRPILSGVIAGILLALIRMCWFYVANRMSLPELERTHFKDSLFALGCTVLLCFAIVVAMSDSHDWWKTAALGILVALSVGAIGALVGFAVAGVDLAANSTDIGIPFGQQVFLRTLTLAAFLVIGTAVSLLCGLIVRTIVQTIAPKIGR